MLCQGVAGLISPPSNDFIHNGSVVMAGINGKQLKVMMCGAATLLALMACSTSAPNDAVAAEESKAQPAQAPDPVADANDPLLKPIAPDYANRWLGAAPPTKVYGNFYLVGFSDLNVGLIKTSEGLILIDGAVPQAVRDIEKNVQSLGFKLSDIKYILNTEPHYDHAGGLAALSRDTGATVVAGELAVEELRTGVGNPKEPQGTILEPIPGVTKIRGVKAGEKITLGDVTVTAVATPGHTLGSTSWSWQSCEGNDCKSMVFAASPNPASADEYRFSSVDGKPYVDAYATTFAALRAMPCDILITAHPSQSGGADKLKQLTAGTKPNPYVDANACKALAGTFEKKLKDRLAKEAKSGS